MKTNRRRNERNGISDWNCFPSFVDARRRRTNRPTAANFGLCPEEGRRMTLLPRGHNQAKNESQSGLQEGWRRERGAHFSTPPLLLPRLVVHKIRTYRFIKTHYPSHPPSLSGRPEWSYCTTCDDIYLYLGPSVLPLGESANPCKLFRSRPHSIPAAIDRGRERERGRERTNYACSRSLPPLPAAVPRTYVDFYLDCNLFYQLSSSFCMATWCGHGNTEPRRARLIKWNVIVSLLPVWLKTADQN